MLKGLSGPSAAPPATAGVSRSKFRQLWKNGHAAGDRPAAGSWQVTQIQQRSHMVSWGHIAARCRRQWEKTRQAAAEPTPRSTRCHLQDFNSPAPCSPLLNKLYWRITPTLRFFTRNSRHRYSTPMGQPKPIRRPKSAEWCLRCDPVVLQSHRRQSRSPLPN